MREGTESAALNTRVLAPRVAISLESEHAIAALEEVPARYGQPEIVNTDQGSQFTIEWFSGALLSRRLHYRWTARAAAGKRLRRAAVALGEV
jgi:putative transposase